MDSTPRPAAGVGWRPWAAALGAVTLVLLVAPWGMGLAAAHTELVSSDPEDGSRRDRVPARVELRFSDEVREPVFVVVTDPRGKSMAVGTAEVAGAVVTQRMVAAGRGAQGGADGRVGTYRVAYRVVSADGHPITGELTFRVTPPTPEDEPSPSPTQASDAPSEDEAPELAAPPQTASGERDAATETFWDRNGAVVGFSALGALAAAAMVVAVRRRPR